MNRIIVDRIGHEVLLMFLPKRVRDIFLRLKVGRLMIVACPWRWRLCCHKTTVEGISYRILCVGCTCVLWFGSGQESYLRKFPTLSI